MRLIPLVILLAGCPDNSLGVETDTSNDSDSSDSGTDSDNGSDTDNGTGGDTDGGDNVDLPGQAQSSLQNQSLTHEQGTCTPSSFNVVYPEEGFEHNHYKGVRLTPSSYPFEVDAISIELIDDPSDNGCRATTARPVIVAKASSADSPPQRPSDLAGAQTYELMPAEYLQRTYIRKILDESITLNDGEDLWIVMKIESTSNGRTCVRACYDSPQEDNNWFSTNAIEPIGWTRLSSFGGIQPTNMLMEAYDLP